MSYMFIVVIGAVAGWLGSQIFKGSEHGIGLDIAAGTIGAVILVLISRMVTASASGMVMSSLVAIIGGIGSVYAVRMFMKSREVPVPVRRRR